MAKKGGEIRRRLDDLEEDLRNLKEKIPKVFESKTYKENRISNDTKIVTYYRKPQLQNKIEHDKENFSKHNNTFEGGNNMIVSSRKILNDNPIFTCLQSINKNIAKGSEAMKKIASLTELSRLPTVRCHSILHTGSEESVDFKKKLKSSLSEGNVFTKNIREELIKEKQFRSSLESEVNQLRTKLKTETLYLKQKLREEKVKREAIEKMADGYKIHIGKLGPNPLTDLLKLDELTKALENEKLKTSKLEEEILNLKTPLENSGQKLYEMEKKNQIVGRDEKYGCFDSNRHQNDTCMQFLKKKNQDLAEKLEELQEFTEIKNMEFERLRKDLKCLKEYKRKEREWEKLIEELKMKLKNYEEKLSEKNKQLRKSSNLLDEPTVIEEIEKHKKKYIHFKEDMSKMETTLKTKCEDLQKELMHVTENSNERIYELQNMYNATQKDLEKQNCNVTSLTKRIEELTSELQGEKIRMAEFFEIKNHQEEIIRNLTSIINNREKHLMLLTREGSLTLKTCEDMEKTICSLSEMIQQKDKRIEELMKEYDKEKDNVLIKEKMLNDQLDTIKSLRKTINENKREIEDEKAEIKSLTKENARLEYYKEEMKVQITQMENELGEARGFLQKEGKHKLLLEQIEIQIFEKQKEWEEQLCYMTKEKNEAIENARYTTQNLVGTIAEFEKQLNAAKNTQLHYEELLKKKAFELENAKKESAKLKGKLWNSEKMREKLVIQLNHPLQHPHDICKHQINDSTLRCNNPDNQIVREGYGREIHY